MKLNIYGKEIKYKQSDVVCMIETIEKFLINARKDNEKLFEISISNINEINVDCKENETTKQYVFDLKEEKIHLDFFVYSNDTYRMDIDWDCIKTFYEIFGGIQDKFISTIKKGKFAAAKKLNKKYPDQAYPSLSDSYFARWIVKTGNLDFLKWAKKVDDNIDFSPQSKFENPLKIAIGYSFEDIAIWLIDNYNVSIFDSFEPLSLFKTAYSLNLHMLVKKMYSNPKLIELLIKFDMVDYLPEESKEIFLF